MDIIINSIEVDTEIQTATIDVTVDLYRGERGLQGETGAQGAQGATGATGAAGKSAYQSYLDTTTDNPPMTEGQWSNQIGAIYTLLAGI